MIQTAENVAKEAGITREECDAVALRRYEQYMDASANDNAFKKTLHVPGRGQAFQEKKPFWLKMMKALRPCTKDRH